MQEETKSNVSIKYNCYYMYIGIWVLWPEISNKTM